MEITEVRIKLCDNDPVRAIVSITFDEAFVVKGIRILHVHDRYIVCMPSRPRKDGRHQDVAHPINAATRDRFNKIILDAYEEEFRRRERGEGPSDHPEDEPESPAAWAP
ncbi:MAG: SpoVG family protein [Candidatus Eisenbacteria bacterium]|nr:SpoVG family protein [Candidatus Eisenbacteria bacterium]